MMPPARCTSSMWYLSVLGATLHSCGTVRERRSMSAMPKESRPLAQSPEVQDGVGGAAHGDVQRHGVLKRLEPMSAAGCARRPARSTGAQSSTIGGRRAGRAFAVGMGGQRGAVAGQGQAQRLGQAVHGVGGEHARARAAGRAGRALHLGHVGVAEPCRRRPPPWRRSGRAADFCSVAGWHRRTLPASMGPPRQRRPGCSAAWRHQHAGVILSQLEMHTMASAQWALTMYSTESAMMSRLGSEYSMPSWPMAIPSSTAMVLNSLAHAACRLDLARHKLPGPRDAHAPAQTGEGVDHRDDGFLENLHPSCRWRATARARPPCCRWSFGTVFGHGLQSWGMTKRKRGNAPRAIIGACNNTKASGASRAAACRRLGRQTE